MGAFTLPKPVTKVNCEVPVNEHDGPPFWVYDK